MRAADLKQETNVKSAILKILRTDKSFCEKFLQIDKLIHDNELTDFCFVYDFPYKEGFSLSVENNEVGGADVILTAGNKTYGINGEVTYKQLYENCKSFDEIIKKERLSFAPKFTEDFYRELLKVEEGTIVHFNTGMSVVCSKKSKSELEFRKCFEGRLSNLSVNDFKSSEVFKVNSKDLLDVQYLYNKAYDFRTYSSDVRISPNGGNGKYIVTDIEKDLKPNQVKVIKAGPIKFRVINENGKRNWYDSAGKFISREDVSLIMGWAKTSMAEIELNNEEGRIKSLSAAETELVNTIKNLAFTAEFKKIIDKTFEYSKQTQNAAYLNMTGLMEDENHNHVSTTFAFMMEDGQNKIYRITYEDNDFNKRPENIRESDASEFIEFCQQKYDETCKMYINTYEQDIDLFLQKHPDIQREAVEEVLLTGTFDKLAKENSSNPLQISENDINTVSKDLDHLVKSFMKDRDKCNFVPASKLLYDDPEL